MTTLLWILGAIGALLALAAGIEAYLKRGIYRPLSSHAVGKRRWDDPARMPPPSDTPILGPDRTGTDKH